jgi:hypothetical protein
MRRIGFADAKRTSSGRDGGIDVQATGAVAQVKMHWNPVGRPDLQRLHGAARGEAAFFFSLQGYGQTALQWGDSVGMALFRFDLEGLFSPVNQHAREALVASEAASALRLESEHAAAPPGQAEDPEKARAATVAALEEESRVQNRYALGKAEAAARSQVSDVTSKLAKLSDRRDYLIQQRERLLAEEADPQLVVRPKTYRPGSKEVTWQATDAFLARMRERTTQRNYGPMPTDSEDAWRAIVDTNTKIDELTVERERLLVRHQELRDALSQAIEEGGAAAPEHADSAE